MTEEQEWVEVEDNFDDGAEFKKLEIGQTMQGILEEVKPSVKYPDKNVYRIKEKEEDLSTKIFGTSILDTKMAEAEVGDIVKIVREEDIPRDRGNDLQTYRVFLLKNKKKEQETEKADDKQPEKKSVFGAN